MPKSSSYRVVFLQDIDQLRQCVEIQRRAWGFADADIVPLRSLVVCAKIGGQVFGAVDSSGQVLGFLNAFPGYRDGQVYLHSNMMGVLPECQNQGIGRQLKLAQREEALSRGINLVEWTFDPLEIRNARINLELLGAVCRKYLVNVYGVSTSHLHGGMPTDRLIAEWHLNSARVKSRIGSPPVPVPSSENLISLEVPLNIQELKSAQPEAAAKIQLGLRERMMDLFERNFFISRFAIDTASQKATYLLESLEQTNPFL
ncbi:MAG: GNAT family N-acetyltransferase [Acidobacteria bacterium]|nr:GNAT family N-acetyltransferase [Acidobacteriota bacterium]MCI0622727.1 GNAT family N-acetyltransferase [Acidobacteriota bacterium]MCI0718905.1 GNAT family N-acetyltransferase [Acidobacteriota bacterium]